jgi:hypothetical protein
MNHATKRTTNLESVIQRMKVLKHSIDHINTKQTKRNAIVSDIEN